MVMTAEMDYILWFFLTTLAISINTSKLFSPVIRQSVWLRNKTTPRLTTKSLSLQLVFPGQSIIDKWKKLLKRLSASLKPGKPNWKGRISTVDFLLLTSLVQLIFILKILFTFAKKEDCSKRRSTVLSLSLQLVFLGQRPVS